MSKGRIGSGDHKGGDSEESFAELLQRWQARQPPKRLDSKGPRTPAPKPPPTKEQKNADEFKELLEEFRLKQSPLVRAASADSDMKSYVRGRRITPTEEDEKKTLDAASVTLDEEDQKSPPPLLRQDSIHQWQGDWKEEEVLFGPKSVEYVPSLKDVEEKERTPTEITEEVHSLERYESVVESVLSEKDFDQESTVSSEPPSDRLPSLDQKLSWREKDILDKSARAVGMDLRDVNAPPAFQRVESVMLSDAGEKVVESYEIAPNPKPEQASAEPSAAGSTQVGSVAFTPSDDQRSQSGDSSEMDPADTSRSGSPSASASVSGGVEIAAAAAAEEQAIADWLAGVQVAQAEQVTLVAPSTVEKSPVNFGLSEGDLKALFECTNALRGVGVQASGDSPRTQGAPLDTSLVAGPQASEEITQDELDAWKAALGPATNVENGTNVSASAGSNPDAVRQNSSPDL